MATGRRQSRNYSYAYSRFVKERDDLTGLIAYGLFKADKVIKCREYREGNGIDLDDFAAKIWSDEHSNDSFVELYRTKATELINNYRQIALSKERLRLRDEVMKEELLGKLSGLTGTRGLFANICTGLATSFVFIAICILILAQTQGKLPWPFPETPNFPAQGLRLK